MQNNQSGSKEKLYFNTRTENEILELVEKIDFDEVIQDISCWNQREGEFNHLDTFKKLKELALVTNRRES